jgi:hypothetical protein
LRDCARFFGSFFEETILKPSLPVILLLAAWASPALADKLVDPTTVAPEYREAAEKRRAEQIKERECAKKAEIAKVMPRERTAFLVKCLDGEAAQ